MKFRINAHTAFVADLPDGDPAIAKLLQYGDCPPAIDNTLKMLLLEALLSDKKNLLNVLLVGTKSSVVQVTPPAPKKRTYKSAA